MENNQDRPTHSVFQVVKFGAAWCHKGNIGLNIQLDVLPLKGNIVINRIV